MVTSFFLTNVGSAAYADSTKIRTPCWRHTIRSPFYFTLLRVIFRLLPTSIGAASETDNLYFYYDRSGQSSPWYAYSLVMLIRLFLLLTAFVVCVQRPTCVCAHPIGNSYQRVSFSSHYPLGDAIPVETTIMYHSTRPGYALINQTATVCFKV